MEAVGTSSGGLLEEIDLVAELGKEEGGEGTCARLASLAFCKRGRQCLISALLRSSESVTGKRKKSRRHGQRQRLSLAARRSCWCFPLPSTLLQHSAMQPPT